MKERPISRVIYIKCCHAVLSRGFYIDAHSMLIILSIAIAKIEVHSHI